MPNELPPVTDVNSAALHIEGLLDMSGDAPAKAAPEDDPVLIGDNESDEGEAPESDAAPDEMPASEDEIDENDTAPQPIEPPKSWSKEEQSKFRELPPELQETISRRESERDRTVSQKMTQVAEQRKAAEAQLAQATAVQTQYAQTINQLLTLTVPELQTIEQTDWQKLAQDDPSEYVRLSAVRDGLRQRVGFMQQQMQQAQVQQLAQLQQRHQAILAEQYEKLTENVPEFKDPETAKSLVNNIGSTMQSYGFTPEEISGVADARIVQVMAELARYRKSDMARQSAQSKRGGAPAPRVNPVTATPVREDNQNRKLVEQYQALRKSGSARDAARLIENIL